MKKKYWFWSPLYQKWMVVDDWLWEHYKESGYAVKYDTKKPTGKPKDKYQGWNQEMRFRYGR